MTHSTSHRLSESVVRAVGDALVRGLLRSVVRTENRVWRSFALVAGHSQGVGELNHRPRAVLDDRSPLEYLTDELGSDVSNRCVVG